MSKNLKTLWENTYLTYYLWNLGQFKKKKNTVLSPGKENKNCREAANSLSVFLRKVKG